LRLIRSTLTNPSAEPAGTEESQQVAATVYAAFIARMVADEESRRSSIEQRGLAVVTTTGVLTTALFGIAALVKPSSNHGIPRTAHGSLALALLLLLLAAVSALLTNLPMGFHKITTDELQSIVTTDLWSEHPVDAMQRIASTQVKELRSARGNNNIKAWLLMAAMSLEIGGLAVLGWTVYEVVRSRS
jgi:hypothetical protein